MELEGEEREGGFEPLGGRRRKGGRDRQTNKKVNR